MTAESSPELALGVLPLGTANDFAEALGIDAAGQQIIRDLYLRTH
jgi:diacylglycerol kinase family enzyme